MSWVDTHLSVMDSLRRRIEPCQHPSPLCRHQCTSQLAEHEMRCNDADAEAQPVKMNERCLRLERKYPWQSTSPAWKPMVHGDRLHQRHLASDSRTVADATERRCRHPPTWTTSDAAWRVRPKCCRANQVNSWIHRRRSLAVYDHRCYCIIWWQHQRYIGRADCTLVGDRPGEMRSGDMPRATEDDYDDDIGDDCRRYVLTVVRCRTSSTVSC